jgi:GNAT superfamily N-acetyltransferase
MTAYAALTSLEREFDEDARWKITVEGWLPFMLEDETSDVYWDRMMDEFRAFQFGLYEGDTLIACGNSIPVVWDGGELPDRGWDWALESAFAAKAAGIAPNTLCAISITIARSHLGKGVSAHAVAALRAIARQHGFGALIAPVRPNLKSAYPLTPMERYITWKHSDGAAPFDPWLRTHWRAGARILKVAPESMLVRGTIAQWEKWANMRFPESGTYVVPGALSPIEVDVERDQAVYIEPNVWMLHEV